MQRKDRSGEVSFHVGAPILLVYAYFPRSHASQVSSRLSYVLCYCHMLRTVGGGASYADELELFEEALRYYHEIYVMEPTFQELLSNLLVVHQHAAYSYQQLGLQREAHRHRTWVDTVQKAQRVHGKLQQPH